MPYTDAEYEYFEQRQLPARPLTAGGVAPQLHPLLQHTDKRPAEEQVYAEPILVNHHVNTVNTSNPLGNCTDQRNYLFSKMTSSDSFIQFPIDNGRVEGSGLFLVLS